MNGKKGGTRIKDLEIWLLVAVPWICWSGPLPCLKITQGLHGAVNQAVFAQWVRLSPQAQRCMFPGTNTLKFFLCLLQVQTRRREKVSRWPQSSQLFQSFRDDWEPSFMTNVSKQRGLLQNGHRYISRGEIPVILDIRGAWPCQEEVSVLAQL